MENLDEALATLINTALAGIDSSVEFLQAEIPDIVVQLLMWHGVKRPCVGVGNSIYSCGRKTGRLLWEDNKNKKPGKSWK